MFHKCTMDDGKELSIDSSCAADAIQAAIEQHRGHRVVHCSKGTKGSGYVEYEIPAHEPLPAREPRVKSPPLPTFFNENEVADESKRALIRRGPRADE